MGNRLILAAGIAAALLAGTASAADRGTLIAKRSSFGSALFDGRGYVLYGFTADRGGRSACTGECLKAWPPLIVKTGPRAGQGAKKSLLGTIRRPDGRRQATYGGHPLYYYVGDTKPGQILCQNVYEYGGLWLIVRPNGGLLR
jgi:predicted lipoprotein with Yx(FWY)xxD motif